MLTCSVAGPFSILTTAAGAGLHKSRQVWANARRREILTTAAVAGVSKSRQVQASWRRREILTVGAGLGKSREVEASELRWAMLTTCRRAV